MESRGISTGSVKCQFPTCEVRFEPSGLKIKPKLYCCEQCRMDHFALRRIAKVYGLSVEEAHEALANGMNLYRRGRQ